MSDVCRLGTRGCTWDHDSDGADLPHCARQIDDVPLKIDADWCTGPDGSTTLRVWIAPPGDGPMPSRFDLTGSAGLTPEEARRLAAALARAAYEVERDRR